VTVFQLDKKGLKEVTKTVLHHGVCGAINKIRMTTRNEDKEENPFLNSSPTDVTTDNIIQVEDYKHPDVCYIIELLRYT